MRGLSPSLASSTHFVCAFCVKSVCLQLCELQSEVAQVKYNLVSLENSFNCSISPLLRSKFDSLHESLCDISSKLDLLSLPSSQAAPDLPNADLQSPQSLVASNFLPGLSTQRTSFATALPSYPPKSPSPSLIPKQQPASSSTSSSSLPASNPISPSTSPLSLIISKWPASSPSSASSSFPSSDYLSSSPSLSLFPFLILLHCSITTLPHYFPSFLSTHSLHWSTSSSSTATEGLYLVLVSVVTEYPVFQIFNVRSMLSNLSSLTSVLLSNPDIVCITDTWLSPDTLSSEVGIPGFTLFRADHSWHCGGVAIYSKSSLSSVLLPLQSNVIELLIIMVQLCSQSLHIVCFYCPPLKPQYLSLLINMLSPLGPAFTSKLLLVSAYPSPPHLSHITTITSLFSHLVHPILLA